MVAVVAPGLRQPLASAPPQQGALCAPNLPPAAPSSRLRERLGCSQLHTQRSPSWNTRLCDSGDSRSLRTA